MQAIYNRMHKLALPFFLLLRVVFFLTPLTINTDPTKFHSTTGNFYAEVKTLNAYSLPKTQKQMRLVFFFYIFTKQ